MVYERTQQQNVYCEYQKSLMRNKATLSPYDCRWIRLASRMTKLTNQDLADSFGVTRGTISKIKCKHAQYGKHTYDQIYCPKDWLPPIDFKFIEDGKEYNNRNLWGIRGVPEKKKSHDMEVKKSYGLAKEKLSHADRTASDPLGTAKQSHDMELETISEIRVKVDGKLFVKFL